ncbi:hypothetical protein MTO96_042744 [Rhipicephalus appendiculatus]
MHKRVGSAEQQSLRCEAGNRESKYKLREDKTEERDQDVEWLRDAGAEEMISADVADAFDSTTYPLFRRSAMAGCLKTAGRT